MYELLKVFLISILVFVGIVIIGLLSAIYAKIMYPILAGALIFCIVLYTVSFMSGGIPVGKDK